MSTLRFEWPEFLQPYVADARLQALVILLVSILAARLANLIFDVVLPRLTRRTRTSLDDQAIALVRRPIFWSVVILGIHGASQALARPDPVPLAVERLLKTVAILIWSFAGLRLWTSTLRLIGGGRTRGVLQMRTLPLFLNIGRVFFLGLGSYMLFVAWDIDVSAWLASAGVIGIAVGFAARDSLANLFAGVFIITDQPYGVGDYIILDTGERGKVTDIGLRTTRILTRDDLEVTIPNSVIGNAKIINESGGPYRYQRLRIPVGVAYGSDVDKVRDVLLEVARSDELVRRDPEPRVRFRRFGESSLDFELLCWVDLPENRGQAIDALLTSVYKQFKVHGIEIPFPQRDLHVRQWPSPPA